jgi:hypothetical protein
MENDLLEQLGDDIYEYCRTVISRAGYSEKVAKKISTRIYGIVCGELIIEEAQLKSEAK